MAEKQHANDLQLDLQAKCNGYLNCKATFQDGKRYYPKKWSLYWVKLNTTRLEFYTVEWMANYDTSKPPPADTAEPDQHKHIQRGLCFDITDYLVSLLPAHEPEKFVFHLVLPHVCNQCSKKCTRSGKPMHEVLLQAPNDTRCHDWASSLQKVIVQGGIPISKIETRLRSMIGGTKTKSSMKLSTPAPRPEENHKMAYEVEQDLELLKDKLSQCRLTEEHLNYMYGAVQKANDIAPVFHFYNKTTNQCELVNGLRNPLLSSVTKDYYLYPGADWSKLSQGEEVYILGRHLGNMYYVMTKNPHVCCQGNPVKWDSGFLSVAAPSRRSLTSESSDSVASSDSDEDQEPEVFDLEQSISSVEVPRRYSCPESLQLRKANLGTNGHSKRRPPDGARPFSYNAIDLNDSTDDTLTGIPSTDDTLTGISSTDDNLTSDPTDDSPMGGPPTVDTPGNLPTEETHPGNLPTEDTPPSNLPTDDTHPGNLPTEDTPPGNLPTEDTPPGNLPTEDTPPGSPHSSEEAHPRSPPTNTHPGSPLAVSTVGSSPPQASPVGGAQFQGNTFMETVLFGFVAGSVLEVFAVEEDKPQPEVEESRWRLEDFKALWKTDDDTGSDIERGSLGTPSSASTYSIASGSIPSLHIEPEPTVQPTLATRPISPLSEPLSRSLTDTSRASSRFSLRRSVKTSRVNRSLRLQSPPNETNRRSLTRLWRPLFGVEREVQMDPGILTCGDCKSSFGFNMASFNPNGRQVLHVFLTDVVETGNAFTAGMRQGDAILRIDDIDVSFQSEDCILKALFKSQEAALKEGRKMRLRVAWRDGDGLLTKTQQRVGKVLELQRRQKKLQDLLERELKVLSKVINEKCSKCEKRPAERECVGEDGIRIKQVDLNALDTDYLVLPTLSCLSMDDKTRAEPFWKCVSDVRRLCGCGLELELGMTTPPSWGEFVLTGGHQLPVKGIFHLPLRSSHESLTVSCTKALQTVQMKGGSRIVFVGFHNEMPRVLMTAILKYFVSSTNAQGIQCTFGPHGDEDLESYQTCLALAEDHVTQSNVQCNRKYSNFIDSVVMIAEQEKHS